MVDKAILRFEYRKSLEKSIICYLAEVKNYDIRTAMDIYYSSQLAGFIAEGQHGIDNLSYKYLTHDLIESEIDI